MGVKGPSAVTPIAMKNRLVARSWPKTAKSAALVVSVFVMACLVGPVTAGSKSKKDTAAAEKSFERALLISNKSGGPFLGVNMQELDDELRKGLDVKAKNGVLITEVIEGGPAQEAGIEDGDIIVEFNGRNVDSPSELRELVEGVDVGDTVEVKLLRENKTKTIAVTIGEYPDDEESWSFLTPDHLEWIEDGKHAFIGAFGRGRLGVHVTDLNEDLGPYFGVKEGEGVLVLDVTQGSAGEKMGIKAGDVITEVGGGEVGSTVDLKEAVGEIEEGDEFDVVVVRSKKNITLKGEMGEDLARAYSRSSPRKLEVRIPKFDVQALPRPEMDELKKEMKDLKKEIEQLKEELEKIKKST